MKIVFLTPYEQPTGQTSRNYDFAKRLVLRGYEVTLITNNFCHRTKKRLVTTPDKDISAVSLYDGARVVWLNTTPYYDNGIGRIINAFSFVRLALAQGRAEVSDADFIVADSVPPTAGLLAWFLSWRFGTKFVYQIRDVWPIALVYDGAISRYSPIYWVLRVMEIFLYRSADAICSSVRFLKEHVRTSGASESKVFWIPNGVDLSRFRIKEGASVDSSESVKKMMAAPFRVTYTGGFGNAHDVLSIIRAAKIVAEKHHSIVLDIYGDGPKRLECERYCEVKGIKGVHFFGSVPRSAIPEVLDAADVLVVAVTDSDAYSFGVNLNKLYDYFAAGKPIIFSCRSQDDPVSESGAGYSVSPEVPEDIASAIISLIEDGPEKRRAMGIRGRQFAEAHYDVNKLVDRFKAMLDSLHE